MKGTQHMRHSALMILSTNVAQNWDTASTILSICIEHNNAECNGTTQLNALNCNSQNNDTQYKHWVSLCWAFLWSWVSLYWVSHVLNYAECRLILYYAEGRYAECRMLYWHAECCCLKCCYPNCRHVECHGASVEKICWFNVTKFKVKSLTLTFFSPISSSSSSFQGQTTIL
jgi:hypothetical protein